MKKYILLVNLILFSYLLSCTRDDAPDLIQSGIQTQVYGAVTSVNGESLADVEIKIGEYVETSSGGGGFYGFPGQTNSDYEFKQFVKTINLNANGSFDFTFLTSGNGNFYKLFISDYPNYPINGPIPFFEQKVDEPFMINLTSEANDLTFIGKEFLLNYVSMKKLYLCEVNMRFNLTNSYPIEPFHLLTYWFNNKKINSFQNPVTLKLFIDKSNPQTLILKRVRNNGINQKAEYIFPASNVETITTRNIIVNETDFVDY